MAETDLHISDKLRKLLPPLTTDERKQLKANIESDGKVREALLYWHDGTRNVVADGMHRWEIVRGTEIPYDTQEIHFANYDEAELWILNHQLGRRNLLRPSDIRKLRGELYNRLKRADKGHGDQKSECQSDTPIVNAAENVAEMSGVSPETIKRDGARVEAMEKLTKAALVVAEKATLAELKALAKLDSGTQDQVARAVRTGQSTIKEAMKEFKPPKPEKPPKATKKSSRADWYKKWNTSIGPLVRLVDKIANDVGEKHGKQHKSVKVGLEDATQAMIVWMGVKK